ncbi:MULTISPECIES: fumarate reductase iron-sulfur subunit [unclassified Campylobacter]|uniref:fumarate reductase iron-sulfur subunit n=1 Tax=unclassified Campylobacter TaxID=2593542 RepID=UPI001BDB3CC1|nr:MULTISPECIES: fumarate reductase iron-sulfur subunit [unclassified Campylobacter]MBZ7976468.1 fumarate reductase iron-sulfur subunit [Campylobacter sp. RM12637]MBZ7978249.1 fumarate reductase iron-sulfur subunit [Campylobacter sp. RM12654]MBZ7980081.1 fumarate reductase iron-sulfur subunit [Campylobacter sp. RM12642]MBZ7982662.1 fumarate reductase iron-sulfur subunit [Campylobacter sp. RM12640]MBZ7984618.1 fumarate reductase iron-sulfur subunit [Campylobacter sp. RM12647]MBZ7989916.1 fumar
MSRKLTIRVFKYNPHSKISKPHFATYTLDETSGMTIFIVLNQIREKFDASLSFDFVCRAGICGSCAMMINGKPKLGCKTLTKDYPDGVIELMPLPAFKHIKDLSVNTGEWMEGMCKRVESWIHTDKVTDISKIEERVEPAVAEETFELDRCIECGICIASCATKVMRPNFIGAAGLMRAARYEQDPHDNRTLDDFYELVGDDDGIFACMSLLACEDNCPKQLPLQTKIAYLRRKLATNKG